MPTTKNDITIPQAGTFVFVVDVVGGPDSLAGYTADMQIREVKASTDTLADLPTSYFTVDDVNRQVVLEIPDEDTAIYDWARPAVYDIYIEGPSGDRWRLIEGVAHLNKTVTREV
jgi:hypothetical protein